MPTHILKEIPPRESEWPDFARPDVEPIEANTLIWAEWEVWLLAALSALCGIAAGVVLNMAFTAWNADRLAPTPLAPTESIRPEARP